MEQYIIPNKLPSEEVNVLSHRKGRLKQLAKRTEPTPRPVRKTTSFRKIDTIVSNSRTALRDAKRIKRNFLRRGAFVKQRNVEKNKLVLVFRHRGKNIANEDVKKTLIRLGLQFNRSATLHRLTPEVLAQLKVVEPFVIWGYPHTTVVRDLLYKYVRLRCTNTGEDSRKPVPLTSNKQVEDIFGAFNILCVDDLVHEIMTVGPHFDDIRAKLRSFILKDPVGGYGENATKKGKLRSIGGEAGFRGDGINHLFKRIL